MRRGTFVDTSSLHARIVHDVLARHLRDVTPTKKGWGPETDRFKAMMRSPLARMTLNRMSAPVVFEWRDARCKASVRQRHLHQALGATSTGMNWPG